MLAKVNAPRCPTCASPLATGLRSPLFPFCSQKCKLVDLSRWLNGEYAIVEPLLDASLLDDGALDGVEPLVQNNRTKSGMDDGHGQ